MTDVLIAWLGVTFGSYFVACTVAYDRVFARWRNRLAVNGWGSVERADADVLNEDWRVFIVNDSRGVSSPRTFRLQRVPSLWAKAMEHAADDAEFLEMNLKVLERLAIKTRIDFDRMFRRQILRLHQTRLVYRVVSCAVCLGFWVNNAAYLASLPALDVPGWWHLFLLPVSHAVRRIVTRRVS